MEYALTRRKMKSIRLRVVPPWGEVRVSAPHRVPKQVIDDFVSERAVWIERQRREISQLEPPIIVDEKACKAHLMERVPKLIALWEKRLGVACSGWRCRKMKTRWGSCNIRTARINLNLVLGAAEDQLLEYVIVHELVHLHERYHNARFYQWLEQMLPDWKSREADLRKVNFAFK